MKKEIIIGEIDYNNLSCGCNCLIYPYGLIMYGKLFKKYEDKLTGIDLIISENSNEGKELNEMLNNEIEETTIEEYLFKLLIKNMNYLEFQKYVNKRIKDSYNEGFEDGKDEKVKEFKSVLNIL